MKVHFGDKVKVSQDEGVVWLTITYETGVYADVALSRKQSKRLRKMLKKAERRA